jgi:hypothetical protein
VKSLRETGEQARVAFDNLAESIGEGILGPECE